MEGPTKLMNMSQTNEDKNAKITTVTDWDQENETKK